MAIDSLLELLLATRKAVVQMSLVDSKVSSFSKVYPEYSIHPLCQSNENIYLGDMHDLKAIAKALDGCYGAFVNINGFACGEKAVSKPFFVR